MSVSEDRVPGEEVGRLKAKDPDLGDNGLVNYKLIDGDGMGTFELSTDSETREAVIKLNKVGNPSSLIGQTPLCCQCHMRQNDMQIQPLLLFYSAM